MRIKKSFTFIELIISIVIFSLVSVAVYSVLSNGILIWRKGNKDRKYERIFRIGLEKIARDLRNSFDFRNIMFEGTEESVSFPSLIEESGEESSQYHVGRVTYFFDKDKEGLYQEQKKYFELFGGDVNSEAKEIVPGVASVKFSYCYLDNATGEYKWKEDWKKEDQDTHPKAVKMTMVFSKGSEEKEFVKTIFMPLGSGEQKIEIGR